MDINQLSDNVSVTITKKELLEVINYCLKLETSRRTGHLPEYLTIKQLSEYINYSEPAIYKMVAQASIPNYKLGGKGKILFNRHEINEWLLDFKQSTIAEQISDLNNKVK